MRVSQKLRKEAIFVCAIAASEDCPPTNADRLVARFELDTDVGDLADEACNYVPSHLALGDRTIWAEAEAMLQTGWCPP